MDIAKKIFVFVDEECAEPKEGQFDQWCAIAKTELEARANINLRYRLGGRTLRLVQTLDDRRKPSTDRRSDERRTA